MNSLWIVNRIDCNAIAAVAEAACDRTFFSCRDHLHNQDANFRLECGRLGLDPMLSHTLEMRNSRVTTLSGTSRYVVGLVGTVSVYCSRVK